MRLMGVDKKITEIRQEQSQYISTMTFEEMRKKSIQHDKERGVAPFTLDKINELINEVRNESEYK